MWGKKVKKKERISHIFFEKLRLSRTKANARHKGLQIVG